MSVALETRGLVRCFGRFVAIDRVDFQVQSGARHALIGPNGAGKTTLIDLLTGFLEPTAGDVLLDGGVVTQLLQHQRARRGLARTFQINRLFPELTVLESVLMAVNERRGVANRFWRAAGSFDEAVDDASAVLSDLNLLEVANTRTRNLAYGKQRLLEVALALASRPRVLLLDEPAAGVPAAESRDVLETISRLPRSVTIVLIEHDMDLVFRFADRVSVLVNGSLLAEGEPEAIARDPAVQQVYLGETVGG